MTQLRKLRQQTVPPWRLAVLKEGRSRLAAHGGGLCTRYALGLAQCIASCHASGRETVLVSPGAGAAGRMLLRDHSRQDGSNAARQALAALGQTQTVALWQRLFDRALAQVLPTHDDLRDRRRYLNARATLTELLKYKVMPVVNENETVAVDELTLGDSDNLAAIVAALIDADVLLIATDIDGLYAADPRSNPDPQPIDEVHELTTAIMSMAGAAGSSLGTGGRRTKLEAAERAAAACIQPLLFNGRDGEVVNLLGRDLLHAILLCTTAPRLQARKFWLLHMPAVTGCILVVAGAARAIRDEGASLAAQGSHRCGGRFPAWRLGRDRGQQSCRHTVVVARGINQYGAGGSNQIARSQTRDIKQKPGCSYGQSIVHRDDLITRNDLGVTP